VVALTQDYVIEAFDAETGASAWKRRMDGYTPGYTIVDGGLWVIDKVDGRQSLLQLSLADGSILRQITPACLRSDGNASSELNTTSLFLFDPDPSVESSSRALYIFYGWYPGCIERWDAASATRVWQTETDEGYSPSSDYAALITPETVYFADGERLWSASSADGQIRMLSEDGDYEMVPLAVEQGVLILRTKRTRGSTQFGLRGFDPAKGNILWDHAIPNSAPYDPPDAAFRHVEDDQAVWSWRLSGGLLRLFTFQADPNQLSLATLNPGDGTYADGEAMTLDISGDSYFGPTILLRDETMLWAMADAKLFGIDLATAKIKYQFP
jgi:outer membrane protein assembly factor BamB